MAEGARRCSPIESIDGASVGPSVGVDSQNIAHAFQSLLIYSLEWPLLGGTWMTPQEALLEERGPPSLKAGLFKGSEFLEFWFSESVAMFFVLNPSF